jgi:hypothetical protein
MSFFDFLFCLLRTIKLSTDMPDSRRLSSVFFTVFCTILFYVTLLHSILFYPFINYILYCAVLFALRTAYEYNEQESHYKIIKYFFRIFYMVWELSGDCMVSQVIVIITITFKFNGIQGI